MPFVFKIAFADIVERFNGSELAFGRLNAPAAAFPPGSGNGCRNWVFSESR